MWHVWETRQEHTSLVGKHEGKRPLRRPRSRGKGNIKMGFQEVRWENRLDWSGP